MSDPHADPKLADLAEVLDHLQSVLGDAAEAAAGLGSKPALQKKLQGTLANLHLVGVFSLLEEVFGERCWENTGCHEAEFKLLWAIRAAIVYGNGNVRKLRGNHQRKTITEGLNTLKHGGFGGTLYFQLHDDVVRLDGANLRLATLVNDLLMRPRPTP